MATHSSILVWRIPGTEEPDGLPSMGSHRVGHDWSDLAVAICSSNYQTVSQADLLDLPSMLTSKAILTVIAFILDFEFSKPTFSLLCEKKKLEGKRSSQKKMHIYREMPTCIMNYDR